MCFGNYFFVPLLIIFIIYSSASSFVPRIKNLGRDFDWFVFILYFYNLEHLFILFIF